MIHKRMTDEDGKEFSDLFSSDRYFSENGKWYYYARGFNDGEPFVIGTFYTKADAIENCKNRFSELKIEWL